MHELVEGVLAVSTGLTEVDGTRRYLGCGLRAKICTGIPHTLQGFSPIPLPMYVTARH